MSGSIGPVRRLSTKIARASRDRRKSPRSRRRGLHSLPCTTTTVADLTAPCVYTVISRHLRSSASAPSAAAPRPSAPAPPRAASCLYRLRRASYNIDFHRPLAAPRTHSAHSTRAAPARRAPARRARAERRRMPPASCPSYAITMNTRAAPSQHVIGYPCAANTPIVMSVPYHPAVMDYARSTRFNPRLHAHSPQAKTTYQ